MAEYTLTIYQSDGVTPLIELGTAAAHPHPYLQTPEHYGESEVDFLTGKATIAQASLRATDPQSGATQAERFLTGLLGDEDGFSALNGARALWQQVSPSAAVILDGVVAGVTLADSFAGYEIALRDTLENARKLGAFTRTGTATVFPRGVLEGYGLLPAGRTWPAGTPVPSTLYLQPPAVPVSGTYVSRVVGIGAGGIGQIGQVGAIFVDRGQFWEVGKQWRITQAMRSATAVAWDKDEGAWVYPNVEVWWRAEGSADPWNKHGRMPAYATFVDLNPGGIAPGSPLFQSLYPTDDPDKLDTVGLALCPTSAVMPTEQQRVECLVVYVGPASSQYPLHYEGTWGEFARNLLRGDYCTPDPETGATVDPHIRYDEAALLAIDVPIRVRLTETMDDVRSAFEQLCVAIGAAAALDEQGRISPAFAALPDVSAEILQIDDDNTTPVPGWEHSTDQAVTQVQVTYYHDVMVPPEQDPDGEASGGDGIATSEVTVISRAPDALVARMGTKSHDIDGWMFHSLGGVSGDPLSGDSTDEMGAQVAVARGNEVLDRWVMGGVRSSCRIRAADFPGLRVGAWVLDARSWRPNYQTHTRGGGSLAQVLSIKRASPAWLDVQLVDAGPDAQPLPPPTLGAITADAEGVVSVPVTAIPVGGAARLEYALGDTEPATNTGSWTFLARLGTPGTAATPPLPAGQTVWIRARTEFYGRRPGAWTAATSIALAATARILSLAVALSDDGTQGVVTARLNGSTAGLRLRYSLDDPAATPALDTTLDVDASAGPWTLAVAAQPGEALTVEAEPWSGWDAVAGAVTGTAGARERARAIRAEAPAGGGVLYMECRAAVVSTTATTVVIEVEAVPSSGTVYLVGLAGHVTKQSGPGLGTISPSGTQWTFNRGAFGGGPGQVQFRAEAEGYQSDDDLVVIPEQGRDTVPLAMRADPVSSSTSEVVVRVRVSDPYPGAAVSVSYLAQGVGAVTPASPQAIAGVTASLDTTGHVDFTIPRAAAGSGTGRVTFTATAAGRTSDSDAVDVPAVVPESRPRAVLTQFAETPGDGSFHLGAYLGDGAPGPLQYRYSGDGGQTWLQDWTAYTGTADVGYPMPQPNVSIVKDERLTKTVLLQVKDGAGQIAEDSLPLVPALSVITEGGGVDPAKPFGTPSDGTPWTPRTPLQIDSDAVSGKSADTDLSGLDSAGWISRTGKKILKIARGSSGSITGDDAVIGGDSLTRLAGRTLDNIADSATYRRTGTGFVDGSGRVTGVYSGTAIYNGSTIASGVDRATSGLDSSGNVQRTVPLPHLAPSLPDIDSGTGRVATIASTPVATVRDQALAPSQNLLGVGAGSVRVSNALSITLLDRSIPFASLGLAPGDVISLSADLQMDVNFYATRLQITWWSDTAAISSVFTDFSYATSWTRHKLENLTIPAAATGAVMSITKNDATHGTQQVRRAMLNRGPSCLPYEPPPFRTDRETADDVGDGTSKRVPTHGEADGGGKADGALTSSTQLAAGVQQVDQTGQSRVIAKGHVQGTGYKNGDHVSFPANFGSVPLIILRDRGLLYPPSASGIDVSQGLWNNLQALNPTASGFKVLSEIVQYGTRSSHTNAFPAGTLAAVGATSAVTVSSSTGDPIQYTATFDVTITDFDLGSTRFNTIVVALDSNDGVTGWTERATRVLTTDSGQETFSAVPIAVTISGLDSTDQVRLRVKDFQLDPNSRGASFSLDPGSVAYETSADTTYSKTPTLSGVVVGAIDYDALETT